MMRQFQLYTLCLITISMVLLTGTASAAQKAIILAGFDEQRSKSIGMFAPLIQGIEEILNGAKITYEPMYTELDSHKLDEATNENIGKAAALKITQLKPAVVVMVSGNCLKYIAPHIDDIPIVFTLTFNDVKKDGQLKPNMTGVGYRNFMPDIFALAKKLLGINSVALISRDSTSMQALKTELMSEKAAIEKRIGIQLIDMFLCSDFDEWKNVVMKSPAGALVTADTRSTKAGVAMPGTEVVQWTIANSKVPVIAATEEDVAAGALFAMVNSPREWGRQTGALVLKIIGGTPVSQLPVEPVKKGALFINAATAQKYKLSIPYEILSIAEKVYSD